MRRGLVSSRTEGAEAIAAGRVLVGGAPAAKAARLVAAGEPIQLSPGGREFVSRAGRKLSAALEIFGLDVTACRCLDAGASTGGFTDCLLQHGARQVFAVDVGHGQLDWGLRNDARVSVLERLDVRALEPSVVPPCDVVTADLSFISLRSVLGDLANIGTSDAEFIFLVKPQFEAGRAKVGKGGIVRDPAVHAEVLYAVCAASRGSRAGPRGCL